MIALLPVLMMVMLVVKFWHLVVAALVLYGLWRWGIAPYREAQARLARKRLCHARARQEIDDIAFTTVRAMYEAAAVGHGDVIEGTAVEVERR